MAVLSLWGCIPSGTYVDYFIYLSIYLYAERNATLQPFHLFNMNALGPWTFKYQSDWRRKEREAVPFGSVKVKKPPALDSVEVDMTIQPF